MVQEGEKTIVKSRGEETELPRKDTLENSPDVDTARQSSNDDRQKALDSNPDKHSGSAGGKRQEASIEFVIREPHGEEKVAFSRKTGGSEKDIQKLEERSRSIQIDELRQLSTSDITAKSLVNRLDQAKTPQEIQAIQKEADQLYGRGDFAVQQFSKKETSASDQSSASPNKGMEKRIKINTQILRSIEADTTISEEKRQLARDIQHMRAEAKNSKTSTEVFDSYAEELLNQEIASTLVPPETSIIQNGDQPVELSVSGILLPGTGATEQGERAVAQKLSDTNQLTNSLEGWLAVGKKISALPLDKQVEVIGSGLLTGMEKIVQDERQRAFGRAIGAVEGVGNVAQNLAKVADFGAALILDDKEKAGKLADEFGTSVGQTIVSGVQLFRAADAYFEDVNYTGDYAKPFRDISRLAFVLNEDWSQKTPYEQEYIKSKFVAELLADGVVGGTAAGAIKKAGKFTEILDIVADEAKVWHAATEPTAQKAVHAIKTTISDVLEPAAETTTGLKMKMPKEKVSLEDYYAKMQKRAESYEGEDIWRGDDAPYNALNKKGRKKAHINMEGDLCPANSKGVYKGEEVTVGHHIDGEWNKAMKAHSPYISFSADEGVAKWGNKTITLNYKELRKAIATGEVTDVEILDLPQIMKKIDDCPLTEVAKVKLRARAFRHQEILIKGKVPQRFFTVNDSPPEI